MNVLQYVRASLPAARCSDTLSDAVSSELCSSRYAALGNRQPAVPAYLSGVAVGAVNIVRFEGSGISRCDRRPDHIRRDNADYFVLCMPLSAKIGMRHDGLETEVMPGQFIFVSTLRPIQGAMIGLDETGRHASFFVRVPGPLLRQRVPDIDDYCNRALEVRAGCGNIMRTLFHAALEEGHSLSAEESMRFAESIVDNAGFAIRPQIERRDSGRSGRSSAAHTLERAKAYVDAHLSDPGLCAAKIAAHCGVSVRYLHAVFAPGGISLASLIRERRLLQCQVALRNDALRHRSIIEIAGQWGFEDPAHFSRAYKLRFGCSPSVERRMPC